MALRLLVGLDTVEVGAFSRRLEDAAFRERVFAPDELSDSRPEHLAGIFAAKEALFKALGQPTSFRDAAVRSTGSGRPRLCVRPTPRGLLSLDLSITHDGGRATAVVVALIEDGSTGDDEECW